MAVADMDALRASIGNLTNTNATVLQRALDAATSWVRERVMDCDFDDPEVQEAIILLASRWYKRRSSPEGVSGFGEFGPVRISYVDPDVERMLEHHYEMRDSVHGAGVA